MKYRVNLLAGGLAALALGLVAGTGGAAAQERPAENLLPEEPEQASEADASFDEAFPRMISDPVVQGDLEPPGPLVQPWSIAHAEKLAVFIEGIAAEGLDPRDYDLQALRTALASGPSQELDEIASRNFVWLVEDLRDGRTPMEARKQWFVFDPDRDRYRTGDLLEKALETGDIAGTLESLNPTYPDYARLRDELAATPQEDAERRKLIRANMDRWRWLPRDLGQLYLITNVPEYQLRLTVGDKALKTYRTIVGKPGRTATPQLAEMVEGVVFNPTWTVPQSIVKGEGLGARVLANPAWARAKGYKATKGANGYISVVQQPGPTNSLGRVKLEMPNPHAIFFHDTPSRHLFAQDERALSHGCIRTERALELGMTLAILGKGATRDEAVEISTSGEYTKVEIDRKIPAYITYFTYGTNVDGEMTEFEDIYGRDAPVLASLDQPRVRDRSNVIDDEVIVIENDPRDEG
ncbi:L,D-transpeptidase family protein [Erythrobacter sp.]|uniref:L,D-transpeptidase family protein n=1 Tax=Erythrobacter sp. TaxID=1042 RepID=UPI001425C83D|nr:L,D-transpeptidase family protein [Erythrobacter sp.]QIQ87895.1 MAG: L,D-transpeptidase family protein [Erythrobacter sp.]